jgi:hypothetical protein
MRYGDVAAATGTGVYAPKREIEDIADCYFYHVLDIPGHGVVGNEWDLRGREEEYLGKVNFNGKRVLELGTASGYLCRYMEGRGADVVGFDLAEDVAWDVVPFAQMDVERFTEEMKTHVERLKNGWWFCHRVFGSKAKVVYGNIYNIPKQIGPVDISTFGSILLHLRNPFVALQNALRLTKETVVVTDLYLQGAGTVQQKLWPRKWLDAFRRTVTGRMRTTSPLAELPVLLFVPDWRNPCPDTWWYLSPQAVVKFLGVLGFERTQVTYHTQKFQDSDMRLYTVVGTRTRRLPAE